MPRWIGDATLELLSLSLLFSQLPLFTKTLFPPLRAYIFIGLGHVQNMKFASLLLVLGLAPLWVTSQ